MVHAGETLEQAVYCELFGKTTVQITSGLTAAGVLDFRYLEKETHDIFMHVIGFVYTCVFPHDKHLLRDKITPYGQLSWSKLGRDNILPEVFAVRDLVGTKSFAFESIDFEESRQRPVFRRPV